LKICLLAAGPASLLCLQPHHFKPAVIRLLKTATSH
jgi:hypothetical protein